LFVLQLRATAATTWGTYMPLRLEAMFLSQCLAAWQEQSDLRKIRVKLCSFAPWRINIMLIQVVDECQFCPWQQGVMKQMLLETLYRG